MIQPQDWPAVRHERTLPPLSKLITTHDKLRLAELADVASSLGQLNVSSRSASPSSPLDLTLGDLNPVSEAQQCRLPSFSETFSDVIAAHDVVLPTHKYYNHCPQPPPTRRGSPGSEHSGHGGYSSSGALGPSPLSTAHTSPAVSPTTPPYYNIPSPSWLDVQVDLRHHQDAELSRATLCSKRRLALPRSRRVSSRSAPYAFDSHHHHHQPQQQQQQQQQQQRQRPQQASGAGERDRHFNQKYKNPDKLFIIYHKDDLKWGWRAIQERRLELLPVLLGTDYDRSVEERRKVAGLNGMYYRQNDLNMPMLAPDGSGLVFVERDGRWWECARSQKCRTGEDGAAAAAAAAAASVGAKVGTRKGSGAIGAGAGIGGADTRPRGMVERYPEEVLLYWENHVRHFVPEEKAGEVYARAKRYSEIRAEQRRQHGVPQWSLDNKEDRVLDLSGPRKADEAVSSSSSSSSLLPRGRAPRRTKRG